MVSRHPSGSPGPERVAVVVSGMHRSGTSALTRVISLLGVGLPRQLIEGREGDNVPGFWEGRAVVDLNEDILASAGSWWGGWQRVDPDALPDRSAVVARIRTLLRNEFEPGGLVVIKDPRLSRLLPLWQEALALERFRAVHAIAVRSPAEVASSINRRNGLGDRASALSWLGHTLDAEQSTRDQPRVFVSSARLIGDWRWELTRLSEGLGIAWPRRYDEVAGAVDQFIEPSLQHRSGELLPSVEPVHEIFKRWCVDEVRPTDQKELDAWREALEELRNLPSPTALIARRRQEALADYPGGRGRGLRNRRLWPKIEHEAYDLEADHDWPAFARVFHAMTGGALG
jgi:hypothetical protein